MAPREKILDKIKKILSLANGAGTREEATAAFAHAARLMAEHHVAEGDLATSDEPDPIDSVKATRTTYKPWSRIIFRAVAKAFRCRAWAGAVDNYNRTDFNFFGEKTDVECAKFVFGQALQAAQDLAREAAGGDPKVTRRWHEYFSYLDGFAAGFEEALEQQASEGSEALQIVTKVPQRVQDAYRAFAQAKGLGSAPLQGFSKQAGTYGTGRADGSQFGGTQKGVRVTRAVPRGYLGS
jgi:hypothetical protein